MDFTPHSSEEIEQMLENIGLKSLDDLFQDIPEAIKVEKLNLDEPLREADIFRKMEQVAAKNKHYGQSLLGGGIYSHYRPAVVDEILHRNEFYTSYTPYQAEVSQGFLQVIFEYQTAISLLTGMEVSNASMYDGGSAAGEAAVLGCLQARKSKALALDTIHPEYLEVIKTYCYGRDIELDVISTEDLESKDLSEYGVVLFQSPTFFGDILNLEEFIKEKKAQFKKLYFVQIIAEMTSLGILKSPAEMGVDILVGEGQSLGLPQNFGGPGVGIFATTKKLLRRIPGRLVGYTPTIDGKSGGFILTLQTREQHIRRERAISNICTNQAIVMLGALVFLLCLGEKGLEELAVQNVQKANYLKKKIQTDCPTYEVLNKGTIYNEFVVQCPTEEAKNAVIEQLDAANIAPPLSLEKYFPERKNQLLFCVTEMVSKEALELVTQIFTEACQ